MKFTIADKGVIIFEDESLKTEAVIDIGFDVSEELSLTLWKHFSEFICEKEFLNDYRIKSFFEGFEMFDSTFWDNGTPDMVVNGKWYDFKTSIYNISYAGQASIQQKAEETYGPDGEIIFLWINENVISKHWFGEKRRTMLEALNWFRGKRIGDKMDSREQETNSDSLKDLYEKLGFPDAKIDITKDGSMESLNRAFLKLMPLMEEFANQEWLPIEDLSKNIPAYETFNKTMVNKFGFSKIEVKWSSVGFGKELFAIAIDDLPDKDGISDCMKMFMDATSLEKQHKLSDITKDIAILKTTSSMDVPESLCLKYGLRKSNSLSLIEELKSIRKAILVTMPERNDVKMTKRGTILVKSDLKHVGIFSKGKPLTPKSANQVLDDIKRRKRELPSSELEQHMKDMFDSINMLPISDYRIGGLNNPYFGTKFEKIVEPYLNKGQNELNTILAEPTFGFLMRQFSASRAIEGGFNKFKAKNGDANEFLFFWDPNFARIYIYSRPPNNETTGVVYTWFLIEKSRRLPDVWGNFEYKDFDDFTLVRAFPFRLNRVVFANSEDPIGTFIGLRLAMKDSLIDFKNDKITPLLFLDYSRQLSMMTDIVYIFYKQIFAAGSLGKNEITKKFDNFTKRDARVCYVFEMLRRNYNNFTRSAQSKFLRSELVNNVVDPIFKFAHSGIASINVITFLKQIYQKDDGVDKKFMLSTAFGEEINHEKEFRKSAFHPSKIREVDAEYFSKNLFTKNEDGTISWEKVSYCSEAIHEMVKTVVENNPNLKNTFHADKNAEETGKNSKVLIFRSKNSFKHPAFENMRTETGIEINNKKSTYNSVRSINLTEALMFERDHLNEKYDSMEDPSLVNMACKEMIDYVDHAVLIMKVKDQYGHAKRVFFIQDIASRNINRVMDNSFRGFLESIEEDMILVEGDEKFTLLEKMSKSIGTDTQTTKITEDQTRFGDMMPLESIESLILSLFEVGYFDEKEAAFNMQAIARLRNRRCLIPSHLKNYLMGDVSEQYNLWAKETHLKDVKEDYEAFFGNISGQDGTKIGSNTVLDGFMEKTVGFILGVLNMIGSVLSAFAMRYYKMFLKTFVQGIKVDGKTHSDDAISEYNLMPPTTRHFRVSVSEKFVTGCENGWIREGGSFQSGALRMSEQEMSKIVYLSSVLATRFFGMRASLLKWVVSEVGEVLQVTLYKNKIITPNIRYYAAIGKDLPGDSYASDLIASVSRSFNVFIHGGSMQSCVNTQFACNLVCRLRFQVDKGPAIFDFNRLPQLFGSIFVFPALLPYQGFSGNIIRLLCVSEKDEKLERQILFMMNDDEIWKQKVSNNKFDLFGIETDAETAFGAIDVFKDFTISFSQDMKSNMALKYLITSSKADVYGFAKRNLTREQYDMFEEGDSKEKIKILAPLVDFEDMSGQIQRDGRRIQKLTKYTSPSFQKAYARVDTSLKIVSRTGYLERSYANPFNSLAQDKQVMTLNEIITIIDASSFPIGDRHYKYLNFLKGVFSLQLAGMNEVEMPDWFEAKTSKISFQERSSYQLRQVERGNLLSPKMAKIIISICMEHILTKVPTKSTKTWRQNRPILERTGLMNKPEFVIDMVENAGLSKSDIVMRPRLLYRILVDKRFKQVFKIDDSKSSIFSSMIMSNPEPGVIYECDTEPEYNDLAKEKRLKSGKRYNSRMLCRTAMIKQLLNAVEVLDVEKVVSSSLNDRFYEIKQKGDMDKFSASFVFAFLSANGELEFARKNAKEWVVAYNGNIVERNTGDYNYVLTRSGDLQLIAVLILLGNFILSTNEMRHSKLEDIPRSNRSRISIFNNQLIIGPQRPFAIYNKEREHFDVFNKRTFKYFDESGALFQIGDYTCVPWYPAVDPTGFTFILPNGSSYIDASEGVEPELENVLNNIDIPEVVDQLLQGEGSEALRSRIYSLSLGTLLGNNNDPYQRYRLFRALCWLQSATNYLETDLSNFGIFMIDHDLLDMMCKKSSDLKKEKQIWNGMRGPVARQMQNRIDCAIEMKKQYHCCKTKSSFIQLNGPLLSLPVDFLRVIRALSDSPIMDRNIFNLVYMLTVNEVGLNQYVIGPFDIYGGYESYDEFMF